MWFTGTSVSMSIGNAPRTLRGPGGLSLIELLVVISIIAVLISLLLPTLGTARESARGVKCMSNLRQIGMSHAMHYGEHVNRVIPAKTEAQFDADGSTGLQEQSWATLLLFSGYTSAATSTSLATVTAETAFFCPSAQANRCLWTAGMAPNQNCLSGLEEGDNPTSFVTHPDRGTDANGNAA